MKVRIRERLMNDVVVLEPELFRDARQSHSAHRRAPSLTKLGLNISIRKNRMVISLPGDVLFASGKAELEDKGKEILAQVVELLATREIEA